MKVIDLIIKLHQMPQDLEVILDKTNPGDPDFFVLKGVNDAQEVEVDGIGNCVLLTPFDYEFKGHQN